MFDDFYVLIGAGLLVAAIVWYISPRSRHKLRRLAIGAAVIALLLAIAYHYSRESEPGAAQKERPVLGALEPGHARLL